MPAKPLFTLRTDAQALTAVAATVAAIAATGAHADVNYSPADAAHFNEGSTVTISVTVNDSQFNTMSGTLILDSVGVNSFTLSPSTSQSHSQLFADEGTHTWSAGGSYTHNEQTTPFSVARGFVIDNVAPTLTSYPADGTVDVAANPMWSFSAAATDPGVLDVLSFFWDLNGDGIYEYAGASGIFDLSTIVGLHDGAHTVRLLVSDGDGGTNQRTISLNLTNTPAPGTAALLGLGGLATLRRRRR